MLSTQSVGKGPVKLHLLLKCTPQLNKHAEIHTINSGSANPGKLDRRRGPYTNSLQPRRGASDLELHMHAKQQTVPRTSGFGLLLVGHIIIMITCRVKRFQIK